MISRRNFLKRSAGAGVSAAMGSVLLNGCNEVAAKNKRPNIIFIYADDWGWGDLTCHGNDWLSTPNLDRLASEGTDFYQFSVNNPVCSPSRTAIMTGHYPARYCVHQHFANIKHHLRAEMPDWLDPKAPMLPRMLQEVGYVTGHFGKWHLTNALVPDAPLPSLYGYDEHAVFNGPGTQVHVNDVCDRAIDFIERHRNETFFANIWVHETHTPHFPTEESMNKYSDLDERRQVYAAVVADGDRRIGRLLDAVDELGLAEDTLVIFSSDNGPEVTGDTERSKKLSRGYGTYYSVGTTGGLRGRKRSLFEGGVRTPFIVRWPGKVPSGKINKSTVLTAVDILPTLCAAAGVKPPNDYTPDGENMLDAVMGKEVTRTKPIFWQWLGNHGGDNWPCAGVRYGAWKLLMSEDKKHVELYNIPEDRSESNDVSADHPEVVEKLSGMIEKWKSELSANPSPDCFSKTRGIYFKK